MITGECLTVIILIWRLSDLLAPVQVGGVQTKSHRKGGIVGEGSGLGEAITEAEAATAMIREINFIIGSKW